MPAWPSNSTSIYWQGFPGFVGGVTSGPGVVTVAVLLGRDSLLAASRHDVVVAVQKGVVAICRSTGSTATQPRWVCRRSRPVGRAVMGASRLGRGALPARR